MDCRLQIADCRGQRSEVRGEILRVTADLILARLRAACGCCRRLPWVSGDSVFKEPGLWLENASPLETDAILDDAMSSDDGADFGAGL